MSPPPQSESRAAALITLKAYAIMCFRIHACVRVILFLASFFRLLTMANKRTIETMGAFSLGVIRVQIKTRSTANSRTKGGRPSDQF